MLNLPLYPTYYNYMRGLNQRGAKILGGVPILKTVIRKRSQVVYG
ncbi:MAG: hypothetical protein U0V48_00960 [Anaerolineales bacterium]